MKLGVLTVPLSSLSLEETMKFLSEQGVQTLEIGCGGFPGDAHLKPAEVLDGDAKAEEIKGLLKKYNLEICAISAHSNGVHPNQEVAAKAIEDFKNSVLVAEKLGVDTVVTFSGCPGDCPDSKYPNWVTCPWPGDFQEILDWQWNQVLIPYWKKAAAFAKEHHVNKIALEMHPGFCVYNPETLLKLRAAVGDIIGANFDPSHLFWQGMDPVQSIRALKGAIHHFHAKDTRIDAANKAVNGVLDSKRFDQLETRSWLFRTIGYGHDRAVWCDIISELRKTGYNGAVSIEHEDALMSPKEGLCKAIAFLKDVIIEESPAELWWA